MSYKLGVAPPLSWLAGTHPAADNVLIVFRLHHIARGLMVEALLDLFWKHAVQHSELVDDLRNARREVHRLSVRLPTPIT